MALLNPGIRSRPALTVVLAAGLLAFCAGCVLVRHLRGTPTLAFSHRIHVVEEGLECVNCHEDMGVSAEPGMPYLDGCLFCHDEIDAEKPPERSIETLFDEQEDFLAARPNALDDEVLFDHLLHVEEVGDCNACHVGIETSEGPRDAARVDMDACVACHAARDLPNACADCHSVIDEDWAPENHALDWTRRHGSACKRTDPRPAEDCSLCHAESSCEECHLVTPPESHNAHWRQRGHGLVARMDRERCDTCHQPFSCDQCHEDVLPRNHTGLFGAPRSTHCLTCHFPVEQSACVTCHQTTPSHDLGPPKPAWHDPSMNCRQCHGAGLPLSHVDDGSNCNLCHP